MRRTLLSLLPLLLAASLAQAQTVPPAEPKAPPSKDKVYKWTDAQGVIHYTDKPPTKDATPAKLPPLQSYDGRSVPVVPPSTPAARAPAAADVARVQIVSPPADEVYRDPETVVPVAVVVTPGLEDGRLLRYYVDGTPRGKASAETSDSISGLERGSHDIAVALVDASGRELARSSVTVHLMPPTVKHK
ncbi:MAG TPA: DUF4124 domain-containing protein [Candidatus Binatia bacterium]|nr:DUF4124 domain-containing protein [Candidatus Binatia bacterium]